jgi:hypothetical protein
MLRPTEMRCISALAFINMTEPGSPPIRSRRRLLFVVPKEHQQLIRKTLEITKRDETDRLGLDVQPRSCIPFEANPGKTNLTYAHKFDYISTILEDVDRFVIVLSNGLCWDGCTIFFTFSIVQQCLCI